MGVPFCFEFADSIDKDAMDDVLRCLSAVVSSLFGDSRVILGSIGLDEEMEDSDGDRDEFGNAARIRMVKATIEKEINVPINADLKKAIKKKSLELSSKIETLQRTNSKLKKVSEDLSSLTAIGQVIFSDADFLPCWDCFGSIWFRWT